MPLGKTHHVLCVSCRMSVTTLYAYPEKRCGYSTTRRVAEHQVVHVSCTWDDGHTGDHYDEFVCVRFESRGRLSAGTSGQTNRA